MELVQLEILEQKNAVGFVSFDLRQRGGSISNSDVSREADLLVGMTHGR